MEKYSLIRRGNYRQTSLVRYSILVIIILGVLALGSLLVPRILTGVVGVFWLPFDAVRIWIAESGSSFPKYFRDRGDLLAELSQLQTQLAVNQVNTNTIKKLQSENDDFRSLLESVPDERLLARVVSRPEQLPYDQLLIDRGSDHGVVENAPVFLGKDQVVGVVSRVHHQSSLVTLISTPGFKATAYIVGPNIYTYAEGMGGGIVQVSVPQGISLQQGNLVVLPAIDSGVYGTISEISTSPTQPEQYGYVMPGISLQSIQYVTIGRTPITPRSFEETEEMVRTFTTDLLVVPVPPEKLVTPATKISTTTDVSASSSNQ